MRIALLALAAAAAGGCVRQEALPDSGAAVAQRPQPAPKTPAPDFLARFEYAGEPTQGGWIRGRAPFGTTALSLDGAAVELSSDGIFLVAFDRDATPSATLVARIGEGRTVTETLAIAPRAWPIEHIDADQRPAAIPSTEFQRIRAGELARIAAARSIHTASAGWRQDFRWPVTGRISGRFGSQRVYRGTPGSYHSGIDIAGGAGTTFVAPADGVVILAAGEPFTLEGNLLMIDHGHGLNSAFLHASELLVREGEAVRRGQAIGRIGMTGRATGPHLHWSLKWREARLDPILLTGPMP